MSITEFVTNRVSLNKRIPVRHEKYRGKTYLVASCSMLQEGVASGSGGPIMYSGEQLSKNVTAWNTKPAITPHPIGGNTACCIPVLEKQGFGFIMNANFDKSARKLFADIYIDEELANAIDTRIVENIKLGEVTEVSTGMQLTCTEEQGVWDGNTYDKVAINIQPDHLAVLLDEQGASKGAGLLVVNSKTDNDSDKTNFKKLMDSMANVFNTFSTESSTKSDSVIAVTNNEGSKMEGESIKDVAFTQVLPTPEPVVIPVANAALLTPAPVQSFETILNAYVAAAPEAVKTYLTSAINVVNARRKDLVETVMNASGDKLNAVTVASMDIATLETLVAIIPVTNAKVETEEVEKTEVETDEVEETVTNSKPADDYQGAAAGSQTATATPENIAGLASPSLFDKE